MNHSAENTYVRIIPEDHMVTGEAGRVELPMITFIMAIAGIVFLHLIFILKP